MALLWIEGFENIGSTDNAAVSPTGILGRKYTASIDSGTKLQPGRIAGHSLEVGYANSIRTRTLTTNATMIVGCAWRASSFSVSAGYSDVIIGLADDTQKGTCLCITTTGDLAVYRDSTLLKKTTGLGLSVNTWYYLEFKVTCNSTTGSFEVRLGGVNVLSDTGVNTKAGTHNYHNNLLLGWLVSGQTCRYDDLYVCDASGAVNNTFLGNMKVLSISPTGDTATEQFTPSANASHYTLVDDNPIDDDTTYTEDSVSGHQDIWDYGTVVGAGATIAGIQINTCVRETDANSFTLKTPIVSGGNTSTDAAQAIGTTNYIVRYRISETDPNTTAAWTANGVNAAQFGVEVG